MLKSRVIFILVMLFAAATLAVLTGPAVAHHGFWQHRGPSHFARHPAQLRQESRWRWWGPARQTSHQSMPHPTAVTGIHHHEHQVAPKSIGPYSPGNTFGSQPVNAHQQMSSVGHASQNGASSRNIGSSSQGSGSSSPGAGSSSQGSGSPSQGAGSSSRNTDSSSAAGSQPSEAHYICIVAMGYCGFNGRPNIPPRSLCHCGQDSGVTR
jgi:hypothetical protein